MYLQMLAMSILLFLYNILIYFTFAMSRNIKLNNFQVDVMHCYRALALSGDYKIF